MESLTTAAVIALYVAVPGWEAPLDDAIGPVTGTVTIHDESEGLAVAYALRKQPLVVRHPDYPDVLMALTHFEGHTIGLSMWNVRSGSSRGGHTPPRSELYTWARTALEALEVTAHPDTDSQCWDQVITATQGTKADPPYNSAKVALALRDK